MTKRIFVAATLLATVCAAHADVLATSHQSTFLDQWKDAKGNDVASAAFGSNTSLIGGVALGNETATQALMKKASADAASGKAVTVARADGISGTYLLSKSNYKAAATGDGVSVTSTSNGDKVFTKGNNNGGGQDAAGGADAGASGSFGGGVSAAGGVPAGVFVPATAGVGNMGTLPVQTSVHTAGVGVGAGAGAGTGVDGAGDPAAPSGEVPEPSTIALMLAGMAGAMSIARRRAR